MKTYRFLSFHVLALTAALWTYGCATFQGQYADPTEKEIVDDKWNETDARKTSEVLIQSLLKKPWLERFLASHQRNRPFFIVDDMENRTDEHLDTRALTEAIRNELINSGAIRFVNDTQRKRILDELHFQHKSGMVNPQTAKQMGKQYGADFLLSGGISSQVHTQDGMKTVTYQTNLILTDLETSEIVWSEKFDIKKRFNRSSWGL